eukprot:tig00001164_g7402.t1
MASVVSEHTFVAVRLRPATAGQQAWATENGDLLFLGPPDTKIPMDLSFDRVFGEDDGGKDVYDGVLEPLVRMLIDGYHGFLFFYGNSKGGKTYAADQVLDQLPPELFGKLRARKDREFAVRFSSGELLNERVRDLLDSSAAGSVEVVIKQNSSELEGIVEAAVTTAGELREQISVARGLRASDGRGVQAKPTHAHYFYRVSLESRQPQAASDGIVGDFEPVLRSHLTLVDMGAAPRSSGGLSLISRLRDGFETQKGIIALERIVDSLSEVSDDPTRGEDVAAAALREANASALSRLVAPALGGNALGACVLCVDGAWAECEATMEVLRFGVKLRRVCCRAVQNSALRHVGELGSAPVAEEEAVPRIGGRPLTKDESDLLVSRLAAGGRPLDDPTELSVAVSLGSQAPSERSAAVAAPQGTSAVGRNWSPQGSARASVLSALLGNFSGGAREEPVVPPLASDPAALMEHHLRLERERQRARAAAPEASAFASLRAAVAGLDAGHGPAAGAAPAGGLVVRIGGGFPFIHFGEDAAPPPPDDDTEERRHRRRSSSGGRRERDQERDRGRDRSRDRERRDRDRDRDRSSRRRDSSHSRDYERRSRSRRRDDDFSEESYPSDGDRHGRQERREQRADRSRDRDALGKETRRGTGPEPPGRQSYSRGAGALGSTVLQASGHPRSSSVHSGSSGKGSNVAVNGRSLAANGRTMSKTSSVVSFNDSSAKGAGVGAGPSSAPTLPPSASAAELVKSYFTNDTKTADLAAKVDGLKTAPLREQGEDIRNGITLFNLEKKPVLDEPLWRLQRSRFRSSWTREHVQLLGHPKPHSLIVFKSKRNMFLQKVKDPQGSVIFLSDALVLTKAEVAGKYAFSVKLGPKQYTWAADTSERRDDWMRHLARVSKKEKDEQSANTAAGTPGTRA